MKSVVKNVQLSIVNFLLVNETFPHRTSWFRGVFEDYTPLEVSAAAKPWTQGIIQSGGERETGIVNTKWKYSRTCINSLCVAVPFPPPSKVK